MSSRSKKTTSATTSSKTSSTPAASEAIVDSAALSPRTGRPASPTMISRVQEKNELASLNDRLATYIERVRQLENENTRLSRIVESQVETVSKETSGIKSLYEGELASARKLLDELAKEKAKLQFENGKFKSEVEDLRERLRSKEKDLTDAEKKLLSAESQVTELQARLNDAVNQRRHWEDEYSKIKKELDVANKSLVTAQKQLEDETIMRVDHENRIQTLKEELIFMSQVHEKELNESVQRSHIVVDEVDGRLQEDYANKLGESLRQMREEMEEQLHQARLETEAVYDRKLAEMRALAERNVDSSDKTQSELRNARKRLDELTSEVSRLSVQNQSYEVRIRELENQLKHEQDNHTAERDALNAEILRLRAAVESQLDEYRDLMDIKIQLDAEIAAYRKLLESEETRLNLSVSQTTPGRSSTTTGESSRKRKRLDVTDSEATTTVAKQLQLQPDFEVHSSAKEVVEISEVSADGKFIKLFNTSNDKDVSMAGWQLKHTCGDQATTYKFQRSLHIKPQQYVTVWSSDADQAHSPPSNLVMKDQKWNGGNDMQTSLLDSKGEELATHSMKRTLPVAESSPSSSSQESQKTQRKSWGWSLFSMMSK